MNTKFYPLLLVSLFLAVQALRAEEPVRGKVLLLLNERVLEGDITREGETYRIRRSIGETTIPANQVRHLCNSKEEAFAFLRARVNASDPDERLVLARWCHLQELKPQALEEARAALTLRPEHGETQRLVRYLEQSVQYSSEAVKSPTSPPTAAELAPVELSADSMSFYVTRVEPILMNACAKCHLAENAGAFQLQRVQGRGIVHRKALQHNLINVLSQLNVQEPTRSPLLIKAMSVHGSATEAPLHGRQAEALQALEEWVKLTAATPQVQKRFGAPPAKVVQAVQTPAPQPEKPAPTAAKKETPFGTGGSPGDKPATKENVPPDEYDPAQFNSRVRTDKKPPLP